ncbi:MAG: hypothetical protein IPI49_15365 [Myxococcales bacterium]|jgi:hypothetical protein|nr:hypothetical protein [Myxococcales bacterium]HRC58400.1 hypothetical protein [Kofleriaceae bacterium]
MDSYVVRRCEPSEIRESIEQLWERNLPIEQSAVDKFSWLYEQAPLVPRDVFVIAAAAQGGEPERPVGTAGVGLRDIYVGGGSGARAEILRAGLLADLAVDREHRTVAPALRLVREVRAWALSELDLAYGFPNQHAQGVFRRVGYSALGAMSRYVRVLRYGSYLSRASAEDLKRLPAWARPLAQQVLSRPGRSQRLAATAYELAQLARDARGLLVARRHEPLTLGQRVPAGVDALFHRCRTEYDLVAVRSDRLLRWRYPAAPGRLWAAVRSGSRLDAYAMIDRIGDAMHLRDVFGTRAGVAALLSQLVFECYRLGASSVSMRFLGESWMTELLASLRFEKRAADRSIYLGISPRVVGALRERLSEPACWFLTDFDEDV